MQDNADSGSPGRGATAQDGIGRHNGVAMKVVAVIASTVAALLVAALAGAAAVVYGGVYNVAATRQHTQLVYSLLEITLRHSVRLRANGIAPPPLDDAQRIARGAACFKAHCVQCHGAPGVSQGEIGKSMQPLPGPLVDAPQRWRPQDVYWITRHGIKMSGMPAWEFRLADEQIWDVTAFMQRLPDLTPEAYAEATQTPTTDAAAAASWTPSASNPPPRPGCAPAAAEGKSAAPALAVAAPSRPDKGDVEQGRRALYQYACSACHTIPGVTGSSSNVGPPLKGLARRSLIAGRLANTPDNLVRWIRHPHEVKPLSAMPDMGVTDAHARDIAAYLATLD